MEENKEEKEELNNIEELRKDLLNHLEKNEELSKDEQTQNVKEDSNESEVEETPLEQVQRELEEMTDRYKRVLAEFENHKKRSQKERTMLYNSILGDVVEQLLPIIDNLENATKVETKDEEYKKGVELVLKQFKDVLTSKGVEEIKAVGETFDPALHEAVSSIQDEKLGEKEIATEYRKGYKIGNKVIRHSMVVVAN